MKKRRLGNDEDRDKITKLLKKESDGDRKERLIALKLGFSDQNKLNDIAKIVGRDRATVQRWFAHYRRKGLDSVLSKKAKKGRPSNCDDEMITFIDTGLEFGRWNTAVQAQQDLEQHFNQSYHYQSVWRWLKKATGVLRVPRPVHEKRDPAKAEAFKRSFYGKLKALPIQKDKAVKIWFADESRYGLLPVVRRCWTKKSLRQHKRWQTRYEWSYCYGALDVVGGDAVFLQTPSVNLEWTQAFLEQIKKEYPDHEHIVVWDGAGFHPRSSEHAYIPCGIHIIMLPPYSPELNPIEKLWDCIQDHTSNKLWPSIKRMDQVVALLLKDWWENQQRVIQLVGKNWHRLSANVFAD
jgi:transposase